ncbi:MAG: ABC transporter ATP-binding protein [Candidatus Margulisiibacteriota bacterium]|jgi:ABC-2 type transport system ATP-binding protein
MIIKVKNVTKKFKNITAVNQVSLNIPSGQFIAILGPNGAGKTTLVEMIEGIQKPNTGEISIKGKTWAKHDQELKKILGICLQETQYMEKVTVEEMINLFACIYNIKKDYTDSLLLQFGLNKFLKSYVLNLSGGQRQKLSLLLALINNPEILILDEPTTGLDPNFRREIWDLLLKYKSKGLTLILTTHYMEEADILCDQVILMNHGSIINKGTKQELLALLENKHKILFEVKEKNSLTDLSAFPCPFKIKWNPLTSIGEINIDITEEADCLIQLFKYLKDLQLTIERLEIKHNTLEDVFINLTGETLSD